MQRDPEVNDRALLHRSEIIFLSAAVAVVFGVVLGYETLGFLWGAPAASLGLWAASLLGFVIFLGVTAVLSRTRYASTR